MSDYYFSIKRLNNSSMNALARSPAHYMAALNAPSTETGALSFGIATHCAVLEAERFAAEYTLGSKANAKPGGRIIKDGILSQNEMDAITGIKKAFDAAFSLVGCEVEKTLIWTDADSGAECKGRLDILAQDGIIWDLKTTNDSGDFAYSAKKYSYPRQAAFYLDGAKAMGMNATGFGWIVVEKEAPYGLQFYKCSEFSLEAGRQQYKPLAALYAECQLLNEWPGYSKEVKTI